MNRPVQSDSIQNEGITLEMGPVALAVADLKRSLAFYKEVLGCRELASSMGNVVIGSERPMLLLSERRDAPPRPVPSTGLYHVAFLLPSRTDLACALRHLFDSGYPPRSMEDHGISEALYLSDPEGNGIELYRDRPRSAWPWHHGKLEATPSTASMPLSAESLLAELDGVVQTWRGLPPFTRIGHVHLQVADLAQSAAFYQRTLGLEESITGLDGVRFFAAGGYHHHIGCNVWETSGAPSPPSNALGLRFFTLRLPERSLAKSLLSRLSAAGIAVVQQGESHLLCDPAGNGLVLTSEALQDGQQVIALAESFGL